MAIDIETGTNLFTYYWPKIQDQTAFQNLTEDRFYKLFPAIPSGSNYVPYSLSDPLALDVRNSDSHMVGDDGYVDTVYVGDLLGNFYGLKFNFDTTVLPATSGDPVANTNFGIKVDWWQTKETYQGSPATKTNVNYYRGLRQPITVPPVASFDGDTSDGYFLHVIFGAGKFEDIPIAAWARRQVLMLPGPPSIISKTWLSRPRPTSSVATRRRFRPNFKIEVNPRCPRDHPAVRTQIRNWPKSGDDPCVWIKDDLVTRDCGEDADCPRAANPSNSVPIPAGTAFSILQSP